MDLPGGVATDLLQPTTQHAPGSDQTNDSSADPTTGNTVRITLARDTSDLTWNAGYQLL